MSDTATVPTRDPSWTPRGFLTELALMPPKQRRKAAKQILDLLAQAEEWQKRGATPEVWDQIATERLRLIRENGIQRAELEELRGKLAGCLGGMHAQAEQDYRDHRTGLPV